MRAIVRLLSLVGCILLSGCFYCVDEVIPLAKSTRAFGDGGHLLVTYGDAGGTGQATFKWNGAGYEIIDDANKHNFYTVAALGPRLLVAQVRGEETGWDSNYFVLLRRVADNKIEVLDTDCAALSKRERATLHLSPKVVPGATAHCEIATYEELQIAMRFIARRPTKVLRTYEILN